MYVFFDKKNAGILKMSKTSKVGLDEAIMNINYAKNRPRLISLF
jgi:hypothetical protein